MHTCMRCMWVWGFLVAKKKPIARRLQIAQAALPCKLCKLQPVSAGRNPHGLDFSWTAPARTGAKAKAEAEAVEDTEEAPGPLQPGLGSIRIGSVRVAPAPRFPPVHSPERPGQGAAAAPHGHGAPLRDSAPVRRRRPTDQLPARPQRRSAAGTQVPTLVIGGAARRGGASGGPSS